MSATKNFLMDVSESMNLGGEITPEVIEKAEEKMADELDRVSDETVENPWVL
jgi:hypothetical protein